MLSIWPHLRLKLAQNVDESATVGKRCDLDLVVDYYSVYILIGATLPKHNIIGAYRDEDITTVLRSANITVAVYHLVDPPVLRFQ
jgi:hypothetical protein